MRRLTPSEKERVALLMDPGREGGAYTREMIDEARAMAAQAASRDGRRDESFDWSDWLGPARRKVLGIPEHPEFDAAVAEADETPAGPGM